MTVVEDRERAALATWSRLVEPVDLAAVHLIDRVGAATALEQLRADPAGLDAWFAPQLRPGADPPSGRWLSRIGSADGERDLDRVRRLGGRFLVPGDPDWPGCLDDLGERRPLGLWLRGPLSPAPRGDRSVALVGARACTDYGRHVTGVLAAGCAREGVAVVSGAAFGIDARAHRAALACGGATVAVLACGVDLVYPRGNADLVAAVRESGVLVSEFPPGTTPARHRFVERNRVIAALSGATVVVEAGWRSGAAITAREAVELGRGMGAVPGPVTSAASAGCHRLLRLGATCVTGTEDLLELLTPIGALPEVPVPAAAAPDRDHDGLDEATVRVLDALAVGRGRGMVELVVAAGLPEARVEACLGVLAVRGLAVPDGGGWRRGGLRERR